MHSFFFKDMLTHDYEEYGSEPFFSFIALWKYAEESNFFEKLFRTQWNNFMVMYIELQKSVGFKSSETLQEFNQSKHFLERLLQSGEFRILNY